MRGKNPALMDKSLFMWIMNISMQLWLLLISLVWSTLTWAVFVVGSLVIAPMCFDEDEEPEGRVIGHGLLMMPVGSLWPLSVTLRLIWAIFDVYQDYQSYIPRGDSPATFSGYKSATLRRWYDIITFRDLRRVD